MSPDPDHTTYFSCVAGRGDSGAAEAIAAGAAEGGEEGGLEGAGEKPGLEASAAAGS